MLPTVTKRSGFSLTLKGFLTAGLILAMLIPSVYVYNLVEERQERQKEVIDEVSSKWAYKQTLSGPYLQVPYTFTLTGTDGKTTVQERSLIILPDSLQVQGSVQPQFKERGIYKVALYRSQLSLAGYFNLAAVQPKSGESILWDKAVLCMGVSDTRGIEVQPQGTFGGSPLQLGAGLPENFVTTRGASTAVDLSTRMDAAMVPFAFDLRLRGSQSLQVLPLGKATAVQLESPWHSPSFTGTFLPDHTTTPQGFTAAWNVLHFNRDFPQVWKNQSYPAQEFAFGLELLQPTDNYAKTLRSVKYAILFIGLTFGFFFLLEAIQGHRVHPVQYILTGLALVIFYTLLLSFSEIISFNLSYGIAALATTLLITLYGKHLFASWKNAAIIGTFLGGLYGFIFVLIQLEDTALLAGSIGLFVLVALAMQMSRKVKWYDDAKTFDPFPPKV